jgi:hypothetical protein|tara:strand:+ start:680 stop:841 length:162 start_codon:yes stop_codon:yes gene_type:complete
MINPAELLQAIKSQIADNIKYKYKETEEYMSGANTALMELAVQFNIAEYEDFK